MNVVNVILTALEERYLLPTLTKLAAELDFAPFYHVLGGVIIKGRPLGMKQ